MDTHIQAINRSVHPPPPPLEREKRTSIPWKRTNLRPFARFSQPKECPAKK